MTNLRRLVVASLLFGPVVHPLGLLLHDLATGSFLSDLTLSSYLFFTAFAATPLLMHGAIAGLLLRFAGHLRAVQVAIVADLLAAMVMSLAAQILGAHIAPTDAQGAIAFVFLPLYAGAAAGLVGIVALVIALLNVCILRARQN